MRHVLSALVQNVPGVLAHVAGMFSSRGYNIDSLAVGATEDPSLSRMTFVVVGDETSRHPGLRQAVHRHRLDKYQAARKAACLACCLHRLAAFRQTKP